MFSVECWPEEDGSVAFDVPSARYWHAIVLWHAEGAPAEIHRLRGCTSEGEALAVAWAWVAALHAGIAKAVGPRPVGNLKWADLSARQIAHLVRVGGG